jgi:hypothetical protein
VEVLVLSVETTGLVTELVREFVVTVEMTGLVVLVTVVTSGSVASVWSREFQVVLVVVVSELVVPERSEVVPRVPTDRSSKRRTVGRARSRAACCESSRAATAWMIGRSRSGVPCTRSTLARAAAEVGACTM